MTGIIFDIDGTLVNSYQFDGDCYKRAVRDVLGDVSFRDDWGDYSEVTDEMILRDIYSDNSFDFYESCFVKTRFVELINEQLRVDPLICIEVPGARRLFDDLKLTEGIVLGIATGGWRETAEAKLSHVNIDYRNTPIASSDDCKKRIDIMEFCREQLGSSPNDTYYIGDGLWDLQACEKLGWRFVGIGPRLEGKCSEWYEDLSTVNFGNIL